MSVEGLICMVDFVGIVLKFDWGCLSKLICWGDKGREEIGEE